MACAVSPWVEKLPVLPTVTVARRSGSHLTPPNRPARIVENAVQLRERGLSLEEVAIDIGTTRLPHA